MIDEPTTSEDAVQSNKLFSRKSYLKQFEPPTVEKELNGGQSLAKNVKEESSTFVKKESANLRKTKPKEVEWAPVEYTESKTRMRRSKTV
jgi:hypothetical protein|tara:strand:- start:236 stop:505 length:270 start_codon:yes stop_codon:yes gene_type:complete